KIVPTIALRRFLLPSTVSKWRYSQTDAARRWFIDLQPPTRYGSLSMISPEAKRRSAHEHQRDTVSNNIADFMGACFGMRSLQVTKFSSNSRTWHPVTGPLDSTSAALWNTLRHQCVNPKPERTERTADSRQGSSFGPTALR